jgi:DME family drug/metabolite transporter
MRRRAYQQMVAVGLLWGTIGPAVSLITDRTAMRPVEILLWRLAIALVPLSLVAYAYRRRRRSSTARVGRRVLASALGVGLLTAGYQWAYFAAVSDIGITVPTLIALGLGPILVATAETAIFGRRPDARTLASLAAAVVGIVVLTVGGPVHVTASGVGFSLASATMYAAAVLAAGPLGRRADVATVNLLTVAGGLVIIAPLSLATGGFGSPGDTGGLLALVWLGVVVSGVAYALYYAAARTLPSTHVVVICLLEPVAAALIAAVAFDEPLTVLTVIGGALMLGAVAALRETEPAPTVATV